MPYYDLECEVCSHRFNQKASIRERSEKQIACPQCGSDQLASIFTTVHIIKSRNTCDSCIGEPSRGNHMTCGGSCCSGR